MQDWEFFAKNFDNVNKKLNDDRDLSSLDIHILASSYLEEKKSCFIKVMENNNKKPDQNAKKESIISNWKEEIIKKRLYIKKKRYAGYGACYTYI